MTTAQQLLTTAKQFLQVEQYSPQHAEMCQTYNTYKPLARGYAIQAKDDWCAMFVSYILIKVGLAQHVGTEVSVERFVTDYLKPKNLWIGKKQPRPGDIIVFDWTGNGQGDHIGFVEQVDANGTVHTIEGNSGNPSRVRQLATYHWNHYQILGYARPHYPTYSNTSTTTSQQWSTGLRYGGHTLSATTIQLFVKYAQKYNILPSLLICQTYYESNWGDSAVGKANNNLGGFTWNAGNKTSVTRPSGVIVTKGALRPSNEGGYYMKYASIEDFLIDYTYTLRDGGDYNVAGKSFEQAIKGLFIETGANANYAGVSYKQYFQMMLGIKRGIEKTNGVNALNDIDNFSKIFTTNPTISTPNTNQSPQYYTIVAGDSLWKISQQFNTTVQELVRLNNFPSQNVVIHPGQQIIVKISNKNVASPNQPIKPYDTATSQIEKMIEWFKINQSTVKYSQNPRLGPIYYDCSSAVYAALIYANILPKGTPLGWTGSLYELEGKLFQRIPRNNAQRGDLFITGSAPGTHTGIFTSNNTVIHCINYGIDIKETPATNDWLGGAEVYCFRIVASNNSVSQETHTKHTNVGTTIPSSNEVTEKSYLENGYFTANRSLSIRNEPRESVPALTTLNPNESVTYDSVYVTNRFIYISYISYSGTRRYIAVRTNLNGQRGTLWGTIV